MGTSERFGTVRSGTRSFAVPVGPVFMNRPQLNSVMVGVRTPTVTSAIARLE